MTDNIFISYSREWTRELANKINTLILNIYSGKNVDVFFDKDSITSGDYEKQIFERIKKSDIGILLLTPENYSSEWLMYEAGALAQAVKSNADKFNTDNDKPNREGVLIPYLFCRNPSNREDPIRRWQFTKYIYKGVESDNRSNFIKLFEYINQNLDRSNRVNVLDIKKEINDYWNDKDDSLKDFFHDLAQNLTQASASSKDKILSNLENDHISLDGMRTKTISQFDFSLFDSITPRTPKELEKAFEFKLNEVPERLRFQNAQDVKYGATRVILNNTRFSTFVAFTDSKRVILYDRKKANPTKTNVLNDRFDVFGSVQFENRTLNMKIESQRFLNAPIERITEINGAAIEDNEHSSSNADEDFTRETAVMFGICVYMKPEDLNLAIEDTRYDEIIIVDITKAKNWESSQLTSKARLAVRYLSSHLD